jgi:hypothetical protein
MDEEIKRMNEIPDILTQVSKEKYRRRLLIASRLIAILLVFAIAYFGYSNYKYGEFVKSFDGNPCFACGYHYGMKCEYVYFESYQKLNSSDKEEFLINLGKGNTNQSPTKFLGGLTQIEFNLSDLDFSNISE